jgi:threonine dehydratase
VALASSERLARGVWTASAGNMAQALAWNARRLGVPCSVVVPDHAPRAKLAAIERLGGRIVKTPFERWWQVMTDRAFPGMEGLFVHPFADRAVMAGNGVIGLEILEDLPDADAVLAGFGGGGLSCGIAAALRGAGSRAKVFACEVATAAPLAASLEAGRPAEVAYVPSFVDGIGSRTLHPDLWPLASSLLAGSLVVEIEAVADAVRALAERARVVVEGAGAAPVAAAAAGLAGAGRVVCVVSGGNLDREKLAAILVGATP